MCQPSGDFFSTQLVFQLQPFFLVFDMDIAKYAVKGKLSF
jgi:hypothetical protein